jgi:hypothetical protein
MVHRPRNPPEHHHRWFNAKAGELGFDDNSRPLFAAGKIHLGSIEVPRFADKLECRGSFFTTVRLKQARASAAIKLENQAAFLTAPTWNLRLRSDTST